MLKFKNGRFSVMQVADLQDTKMTDPDTLRFIDSVIKRERPDMIVFTGDQLDVVGLWGKGDARLKNVRKAINGLFSVIDSQNVPFAVTFGNHDGETGVPNGVQEEIYAGFKNCLNRSESVITGPGTGTMCIPVSDDSGKNALNIILMNTGNSKINDEFAGPGNSQLEWYEKLGKDVPSAVFQHVPPQEIYELFEETKRRDKDAFPAFHTRKGKYYRLKKDKLDEFVCIGETPSCLYNESKEFEIMNRDKNLTGIFFGHDHYNGFTGKVRGTSMSYCPGAGYNTYGPKYRAVRMIRFNKSDMKNFETYTVNYADCCDRPLTAPLKNLIYSNAPSSTGEAKSFALKTLLKIAALCLLLMLSDKLTGGATIPLIPVSAAILFAVYFTVMGIRRKIIRDRYVNGFRKEK